MERSAYYLRKSTVGQRFDRQELTVPDGALVYRDTISGTKPFKDRPQARELIEAIDKGEVNKIILSGIDRLGRDAASMLTQLQEFTDKGINIRVENLGMESIVNGKPSPTFMIVTGLLSSLSQYEKELIAERRQAGLEAAQAKAKANHTTIYKGRKVGSVEGTEKFLEKHNRIVKALKKHPDMSLRDLATLASDETIGYKVSMNTVKKVKIELQR
ncbi:recombinase family protein [Flavobacterium silvaticum]|uniref:Recombinase family protein n=1 Tax=Flavobacterium silvaticum TaxID=1852020 RepID=A0A972JIC3_9FLAO|nr:recombinase family protein [Flavobacterium silvaticum]NMH28063.1 recombinase family protein [Flavobacterium silvaticum]